MMYWILFIMFGIAAIVIAVLVGGSTAPRFHVVARAIVLRAPLADVVGAVRAVDDSPVNLEITADDLPHTLRARVIGDDQSVQGEWLWRLTSDADGTRVTVTERGETPNPLARFAAAYATGHTKQLDRYLRALGDRLGDRNVRIDDGLADTE